MLQALLSRSATWGRSLLRMLLVLVVATVALILTKIIADGWDEIVASYRHIDYRFLALSFLLGQMNVASLMLLWWGLLKWVCRGGGLPLGPAARIFASAWLGRYLPGRIWTAAGKVYLGRQQGADLRRLSISVFFELTLSITAQAAVALILIILFFDGFVFGSRLEIYVAAAVLVLILLAIHPAIFWRLVNRLMSRLGRQPVASEDVLSYPAILVFFVLYGLQVMIMGFSLLSFARALTPIDGDAALFVLASFIAANFVGRIAFIAPAGIGFREGALTALLQFKLSLALASLITVLSRVWLVLIDLSFVAFVFLAGRLGANR
jgi:hypothetical protein